MQRNTIRTFEDLLVWQKAIEFVKEVYMITNQGDLRRDFGFRDQMRRAAVSIPTNISPKDLNGLRERNTCCS